MQQENLLFSEPSILSVEYLLRFFETDSSLQILFKKMLVWLLVITFGQLPFFHNGIIYLWRVSLFRTIPFFSKTTPIN